MWKYSQVGGESYTNIWNRTIKRPDFTTRLVNDSSLARLNVLNSAGTPDLEKIKQILLDSDPTQNKKYFKWIIEGYIAGGNHLLEDLLAHMNMSLRKLISLRDRKLVTLDLSSYCGLFGYNGRSGLFDVLDRFGHDLPTTTRKHIILQNVNRVYEDDKILVVNPTNVEESIMYGKGTKWCTASTDLEKNMFDKYNKMGKLYVIIPKHPLIPNEKFQLHLESESLLNELNHRMDDSDYKIYGSSLVELLKLIKPTFKNSAGFPILYNSNHIQLIKLILLAGASPSEFANKSILHRTDIIIDEELVDILLQLDVSPDVRDDLGQTPLHLMTDPKIMEILLDEGADPNARDIDGRTPLFNPEITLSTVKLLFDFGANPLVVDYYGNTPLFYITDPLIIDVYLTAGMDPNHINKLGKKYNEMTIPID